MNKKNKFETEIDFKSLYKSPSRLFGWIFPYYLVLFLVVGIFFVKNMDIASKNSVKANYTDSLEINASVEIKKGGIMPAIDLSIISQPSEQLINNGKTLYSTNCASCHGDEGKGDGVAAAALNPPPRNFYDDGDWKNGKEFNSIYKTLEKGIEGSGMIAYDFISVQDRISIIHYIRTFKEFPAITDESVAELDRTWDLSKGIVSPNNITLEMAAEKIAEEAIETYIDVSEVLERIKSSPNKSLVNLFNDVVYDKEIVVKIFLRDFSDSQTSGAFIDRITNSPVECGFRSKVAFLSRNELNEIFRLIDNSLG